MTVGILCYASVGGSGIIATELGKMLAARGHRVHVFSAEPPVRLTDYQAGLSFHRVETPAYPLFREPQYLLSLANKVVEVASQDPFDLLHAHYAIPHATAAYLARQVLLTNPATRAPRVVTTLHGTDITLLGADPSYRDIVAFSISQSDGITTVSESLKADTRANLGITSRIDVIPNFVDCQFYRRREVPGLRARLGLEGRRVLIHVSNFRPVKRPSAVVEVFADVRRHVPATLLMVGDGPELAGAVHRARELGVAADVQFLGIQEQVVSLLSLADVFVLTSTQESFGLAALEAMACGVPVVASRVGGVPEVVQDGVSGFLHHVDDLHGMAASCRRVVTDDALRAGLGAAARRTADEQFCDGRVVPEYERCYERVLAGA
ncbi:MAG: N-acetyl-alpha-D-glucosaminyl L-malate synthase BshA [Vicinamibacterales bacterium]